jgi:hypothetical protein
MAHRLGPGSDCGSLHAPRAGPVPASRFVGPVQVRGPGCGLTALVRRCFGSPKSTRVPVPGPPSVGCPLSVIRPYGGSIPSGDPALARV